VKLRDIYARSPLVVSIEFFPPKTPKAEVEFLAEVERLKAIHPSYCSVTYGAGGSTRDKTLEIVTRLHREYLLEVMCHLTVVGQSKDEVRAVLRALQANQIENLIALAGDPPRGETDWRPHPEGFHYSTDLVEEAASYGSFSIAVAGFPEVHPRAESREADLEFLKRKVDAGADVVITQLFLDNNDYYRYVEDLHRIGVRVPIVPGILPMQSVAQLRRFTALCGSRIPPALEARLPSVEHDDEAAAALGIDHATAQCEGLLQFGAPGLHFYSLNRSRSVLAIAKNLSLPERAPVAVAAAAVRGG
jgi:methylenetetrahydrofolate reductase (NADPH)